MSRLLIYIKTFNKLGLLNLLSVFYYRIFTRSFLSKIYFPKKKHRRIAQIFLHATTVKNILESKSKRVLAIADSILKGDVIFYSYHQINVGQKPNWFLNPFKGQSFVNQKGHWTKLNDFDANLGDIKNIWELSRFNWLGTLSQAYAITLDEKYLQTMNLWVSDWFEKNPQNTGPNWKCGQEASIRAINILLAQEMIGSDIFSQNIIELLKVHIDRISPTIFYAKAQDNNHGLSEGVALYLLGSFLWRETKEQKYRSYYFKGLKLIENRVHKLIMDDGSFSQYSVVYHRMVLDLLTVLEIFRQKWEMDSFSQLFYTKVKLAIQWYSEMIDPISGNAPNFGGNDGTYLFNFDKKDYRDFRPTVTLASSVFNHPIKKDLLVGHCLLEIFNIPKALLKEELSLPSIFMEGGQIKLVRINGMVLFRLPKYKFRPSHADALHIDIWQDGINWVRDAGSYSYSLQPDAQEEFSGTKGHSTIHFDNSSQMPRLSRFLFGNWLSPSHIEFNNSNNSASSGYIDMNNNAHIRSVKSINNGWEIRDELEGNFQLGEMRYILNPGEWEIENNLVQNGPFSLEVISDSINSFQLINGYESLYYMEKTQVPILTIGFDEKCTIKTKIKFKV